MIVRNEERMELRTSEDGDFPPDSTGCSAVDESVNFQNPSTFGMGRTGEGGVFPPDSRRIPARTACGAIEGLGCRVWCFGFWVSGFGFRVWVSGCRV